MTDDTLEAIGQAAGATVWRTPVYKTYGLTDEEVKKYQRLNNIKMGRNLLLLLESEGLRVEAGYAPR